MGSFPKYASLPAGTLPEVALLGRSNVGKSSLINMLAGRKRLAKTSGTPGKTTTFNTYTVDDSFIAVDVPGLGYARTSRGERNRWAADLTKYIRSRDTLALVLILMDSRHAPTPIDTEAMSFVKEAGRPAVIVLTKTDKLSGNARAKSRKSVSQAMERILVEWPVVETSAETRRGRDELFDWLDQLVLPKK